MNKVLVLFITLLTFSFTAQAQVDLSYQKPPKEILDMVDVPLPPSVLIDDDAKRMLLLSRNQFRTIAELSETELRLAGLRINPVTNIGSRTRYYNKVELQKVGEKKAKAIKGLPDTYKAANLSWSPDQSMAAFTNTTDKGVELWVADLEKGMAMKLTEDKLNANMGRPYTWLPDGSGFLVKFLPEDRKPLIDKTTAIPTGPRVSVNQSGVRAQNRTYQDLLKDKADEANFEQLALSKLVKVDLKGKQTVWKDTDMYDDISFSPNGQHVLMTTIRRPFSYLVPYSRFPSTTNVYSIDGNLVKEIMSQDLIEELPQGFGAVKTGKRRVSWRTDQPATLYWAEAMDNGDPNLASQYRDQLFVWEAPFTAKPKSILKMHNRFSRVRWGNDQTAVAYDSWFKDRNTKTYLFNPSKPGKEVHIIADRNSQDRYSDPGSFVMATNDYGRSVLEIQDGKLYSIGQGYSKDGRNPFIDEFDIASQKAKRMWQADNKEKFENIVELLDPEQGVLLTRVESPTDYPNYYIRNLKKRIAPQPITFFKNPYQALADVHKEVITYKRDDGLDLSGTLYLPAGYDKNKKEKMPMIMWAYPTEYKDRASASQVTASSNTFTAPRWGSPIYWVTRGYVVLAGASFPIIGEGEEEPNDSFIKQLVANGKAAIDAVDALGYIDRNRVAVGGHSYGAFMTANLLSHSNLFAAGIARSGAYNRTLTPFGFQREERSYWDAPEIYYNMSPFMHADKMKTPLLLTHGEADNNSGTYPLQSERYFNALKGLGAPVRLVMFPKESHGYAAQESVLHLLWEQDQWMEKHVKNRKVVTPKP
ncbi:MAG: prolyl oligopeptidase family serine peptidase [Saprospiraceae bacterium]